MIISNKPPPGRHPVPEPDPAISPTLGAFDPFLGAIRGKAPECDGERFELAAKVEAVCDAFDLVRRLYRKSFTVFGGTALAESLPTKTLIKERAAQAVAGVMPMDRRAAEANAIKLEESKVSAELRVRVARSLATEAEKVGARVVAAIEALDDGIRRARVEVALPRSMQGTLGLKTEEILQREERRMEIRSLIRRRGIEGLADLYRRVREVDPDKAAEMRNIARPILEEIDDAMRAPSRTKTPSAAARDRADAALLLTLFNAEDEASAPPELIATEQVRQLIQTLFRRTLGFDWSRSGPMTNNAFRRALDRGELTKTTTGLQIDGDWCVRFLPGSRAKLELPLDVAPMPARFDG